MGKFYQEYYIDDLGRGLDKYHSLDKIADGYLSDVQNMDLLSNGQAVTRPGYEQYYGCMPLRANKLTKTGTTYKLEFGSASTIDLSNAGNGPIVVAGLLSSEDAPAAGYSGDFGTTFASVYYDSYDVTFRETFAAGTPATTTKTATQTGLSQPYAFIGWFQSDSLTDSDNTLLTPEEIIISKSTYAVTMKHSNPSTISGFFTYLATPDTDGTIHVESFTTSSSVTITAATHALDTTNYIVRCYEDAGGNLTEIIPQTMTINSSGDLTVNFDASYTGEIIIYSASTSNTVVKSATAGSQTFTVTGVTDPFNAWELWITSGGTRTNVNPASITYDDSANTASIEYVGPAAETVEIYWQPLEFIANAIEFTDSGSVSQTLDVSNLEMTVWGICHEGIYKSAATKGGHTHHLDNYKSELEEKLVSGINGNLLQATSYSDGATTYDMGSLQVRGSNRVSGDQVLAPLFSTNSPGYTRTRGNVTDASVNSDGYATVTAVTYISSGVVDYTLSFTSKTGTVAIGSTVSTNDKLTVRNCANDANNGSFKISSITSDSSTSTVIRVANSAAVNDSIDESAISAEANVFTDKILLTATPVFLVGDTVVASDSSVTTNSVVDITTSPDEIYIDSITSNVSISDGINLFLTRTSSLIPLTSTSESVTNFVRGDSLIIDGFQQRPKIKYVNVNATAGITATVSSGTATVTLSDHNFNVGQKILLTAASDDDLAGEVTIASVPTANTFTFSTDAADGSPTATMIGKTVELDESLSITTGPTLVDVQVQGRWTVVEIPKSSSARVPETKVQHFDESVPTAQNYIKSVVVNDSMFFVNDKDEVKKFDGTNLTNASLLPWQGWFFASVNTSTTTLPSGQRVGYSAVDTGNKFFTTTDALLKVGDRFQDADTSNIYTVSSVERNDVESTLIYVVEDMSGEATGGTDELIKSNTYRYYVRANAIDANRNIIASASLGADDMYIETFASSSIDIKIAGYPPFQEIDHDRIEIEVYRTKKNTAAPFYRVFRQLVDYTDLGGYISFTDSRLDETLGAADLDPALTATVGAELGNQWAAPSLASSITTVDNRLLLANIQSPPLVDITFRKKDIVTALDTADFSGGEVQIQKSTAVSGSEDFNDSAVFSFETSATTLTPATDIAIASDATSHTWVDGDVSSNQITETSHGLYTGMKVRVSNSGGALPTGLAASTTYYIIRVDANTYSFASSLANACAGTAIALTTGGGGTHTTDIYGDHIVIQDVTAGGLDTGAWMYLFHNALGSNNLLDFAGWYRISEADDATGSAERAIIDMAHSRSQGLAGTSDVDRFAVTSSTALSAPLRVPVYLGTDGNFNQRFADDAVIETRASTRLGLAINAVMASDPHSNTYWTSTVDGTPSPWLIAQSGQSFDTGSLRVQLVDDPSGTINVQHSDLSSDLEVFINNNLVAASTNAASQIRLFNSRIATSYPNFPEIFDDPFSVTGGDGIIDVNPADGQEVTAIIPFFGQSAFGSANLTQAVVAFKSNAIYLVNVATGEIQKLQSQGQGCTAPRSVALSNNGILFANESGIYRLGWDMKVSWVGKLVNDLWDDLDTVDIAEFAGHNYRQSRQYKLSTVPSGSDYPQQVLVYDHTREEEGQMGAWTKYTNHPATGWANQAANAYWGSQDGQVFQVRNTGTSVDFRDDESAVAEQILTTGGIHYGLPGNRKTTAAVTLQYQNDGTLTDVNVLTEQSLSGTFNASTQVDLTADNQIVRYSLDERKGTYIRVKVTKSGTKDEQLKISRMTFHTKDIGEGAVTQAADK